MFENVISLSSARNAQGATTPLLLDIGCAHASVAPWANDLVRSRIFAKAVHDSVRDASLRGHVHCFHPSLAAWLALVRRHISMRESPSPIPYIWESALCEPEAGAIKEEAPQSLARAPMPRQCAPASEVGRPAESTAGYSETYSD